MGQGVRLVEVKSGEMKRGEIWTVAGGKDYAGKPRPVGLFKTTDSIVPIRSPFVP